MKIYHNIETLAGQNQITLYVEYPAEFEFSLDFDTIKKNVNNVTAKIREYALKSIGTIPDSTVTIILNGVVIGTLMLSQLTNKINVTNKPNITEQVEVLQEENATDILEISSNLETEVNELKEEQKENENESEKKESKEESITKETTENTTHSTNTNTNVNSNKNTTANTNKNNVNSSNSNSNSNVQNSNTSSIPSSHVINVKLANGSVIQTSLEDYVIGVVGAEMPAEFNTEALKAQAVAARTYALKKTSSGGTISATISDQAYNTVNELKAKWGNSFNKYYEKIKNAVSATKGQVLTYNGAYIEALFFSTSNGRTEDSVNVWGNSFAYLKSVDSPWDTSERSYNGSKTLSISEINKKLGVNISSVNDIVIKSKTAGNRVKEVTFGDKSFSGVKVRTALGLRSADFDVSQNGNNIVFSTRGYGHGVGLSQYGANGMAKAGYSYKQILTHYYTGVSLVTK